MWFRLGIVPPVPLMLAHLYDISTTPTCNVNLNLPTSPPPLSHSLLLHGPANSRSRTTHRERYPRSPISSDETVKWRQGLLTACQKDPERVQYNDDESNPRHPPMGLAASVVMECPKKLLTIDTDRQCHYLGPCATSFDKAFSYIHASSVHDEICIHISEQSIESAHMCPLEKG